MCIQIFWRHISHLFSFLFYFHFHLIIVLTKLSPCFGCPLTTKLKFSSWTGMNVIFCVSSNTKEGHSIKESISKVNNYGKITFKNKLSRKINKCLGTILGIERNLTLGQNDCFSASHFSTMRVCKNCYKKQTSYKYT